MRALDTNIVVRFLTGDDPAQSDRARQIVAAGNIFVSTTVILETEWVLRGSYHLSRTAIIGLIETFAGLPGVSVETPHRLMAALRLAAAGLELADAIHLAGASDCTAFVSFDRPLARRARRLGALPVVAP